MFLKLVMKTLIIKILNTVGINNSLGITENKIRKEQKQNIRIFYREPK